MKKRITIITVLALALVCVMLFAACTPASNPEKAKEKLEKKGYTVVVDNRVQPAALKMTAGINGVDTVLTATYSDDDTTEYLTVLYFSSASDAKAAWDAAKKEAESEKKDSKDKDDSNWTVGKSGKRIWFGTKNAVKAAA